MALLALVTFPRPAAAQDPPQEREPTTLEVLSYNVWGVPWVAPEVEPRLEEIARQIADRKPDVVALQELWLPEHAELVTARLEAAGYPYHHFFGPGSAPTTRRAAASTSPRASPSPTSASRPSPSAVRRTSPGTSTGWRTKAWAP